MVDIEAVDLFCGIGGLTYGIRQAGIKVLAGVDIDNTCEYTFTANNNVTFINKSVEDISHEEILGLYDDDSYKVLIGCAPCQPFSRYSCRYNKEGYKDDKWKLLYEFKRLITFVMPNVISMENVPQLAKTNIFSDFVETLLELGYFVDWNIINCANYGVPQNRKRLVLLASREGEILFPKGTFAENNYVTVRDAIANLEFLTDGEASQRDSMHRASKLSLINKKRIRQSKQGGTWKDWDEELIAQCHKKKSGNTYKSVYGRMEWDKPSPTITTQFFGYGNGRFGHPEQDRAISLREGAILQSFPPEYKFFKEGEKPNNRELGTHIGNAVPVKLGYIIGETIVKHLKGDDNNE